MIRVTLSSHLRLITRELQIVCFFDLPFKNAKPRPMNSTNDPSSRRHPSFRRRSQRIPLAMPVQVSGRDANGESFSFSTTATNLNRNGATIHVNRDLGIDSVIVLQNSRGGRTSARIVARVNVVQNLCSYGVEFVVEDGVKDFWGISFPSRWRDLRTS